MFSYVAVQTRVLTTHKCDACTSRQKRSLPTSISFKTVEYYKSQTVEYCKRGNKSQSTNSRVFQKRLPRSSLLEGFCKGFCKCKCFALPLARRMVRDLKEKDDGGTTGGLSSAGTPHNNYCVHIAVHFRQGGGVEGGRGVGNPNPFGKSIRDEL